MEIEGAHGALRIKSTCEAEKRHLHLVSIYRATKTINGTSAAYVQQQRVLLRKGREENPEDALKKDI